MAETIRQVEALPEGWPTEGDDHLWQRLEAWCAVRWTPRMVVWTVEGPGHWRPPLAPTAITAIEVWNAGGFEPAEPAASPPDGLRLEACGPWRITATVGSDNPPPPAVLEALSRLRAYLEADPGGAPGATSQSVSIGPIGETLQRSPAWLARAMEWSGAADLLRPWRRA